MTEVRRASTLKELTNLPGFSEKPGIFTSKRRYGALGGLCCAKCRAGKSAREQPSPMAAFRGCIA